MVVVGWLINVPATCEYISGTDRGEGLDAAFAKTAEVEQAARSSC